MHKSSILFGDINADSRNGVFVQEIADNWLVSDDA